MKKMFKTIAALFFVLGFANADTIRVGTDGETFGYTMPNDKGVLEGYEIDIWNEIGKRTGAKIEFVQMEFSTLFPLLQDGRIDVIANSISLNEERKKLYLFSNPYLYDEQVFMSRPEREIKNAKGIDGWSVGATQGSNDDDIVHDFEKKHNIKLEIKYFENFSRDHLVASRVDLIVQNGAMANDAIEKMGKDKIKTLVYTGLYDINAYPFAKSKRGEELLKLTNKTLQAMRDDGTLKKLSIKWFKADLIDEPRH